MHGLLALAEDCCADPYQVAAGGDGQWVVVAHAHGDGVEAAQVGAESEDLVVEVGNCLKISANAVFVVGI